ncbi:putative regulator of g protein signaling domain protein [Golovinomyces cichoracearum]|uniref:Putative regulator of g protein signaling domain protein n=1 Tax=Golovinomyces cichoracearum TaxID=62708 RepID=A0A420IP16_9PEZI|nr:putative regulator of g protein signaling domain protein [Golovinomyces cichoracearum]
MKYQRRLIRRSKKRLLSPQSSKSSRSSLSTPPASPLFSDWDSDCSDFMSKTQAHHSRSLSLKIPTVTFHSPQPPTLQEILTDEAPSPWTRSAFMAYLSQIHCLENLEFTMDAARYEKHYHAIMSRASSKPKSDSSPVESESVRKLWLKLLNAYIRPNGPRELNLPSDVRDTLLSLPCTTSSPPHPSELVKAVKITYELMDQSVLVPFLNSLTPSRSNGNSNYPWLSQVSIASSATSSEKSASTSISRRNSQNHLSVDSSLSLNTAHSARPSHNSIRSACRISSFMFGVSPPSSNSSEIVDSTDDEAISSYNLVTPPSTPLGGSSGWKKMSAKFCHRKKNRSFTPLHSGIHCNSTHERNYDLML